MDIDAILEPKPKPEKEITEKDIKKPGGRYQLHKRSQGANPGANEKNNESIKVNEEITPTKPDVPPLIAANNEAHIPKSMTMTNLGIYGKSFFMLSKLICQNIDNSSVKSSTEIVMNKQLDNINCSSRLKCRKCGVIKLKFKKKCSHSSCIICIQKAIQEYINNPTISSFKALRCKICYEIPSEFDLNLLFPKPNDTIIKYSDIKFIKKCSLCLRKLNLATEFLPELKCLHLCRECYTEQIFMGIDSCMVCKYKFTNLMLTKTRVCTCTICGFTGNLLSMSYKSFSENKLICFDCQQKYTRSEKYAELFGELEIKSGIALLKHLNNKACPICFNVYSLCDIKPCRKCGNFKCESCAEQFPVCLFCHDKAE